LQKVGRFSFAPLITDKLKLLAEIELVLLRPTKPGALIRHGGDIDNQLKTLFDALRCPKDLSELPGDDVPSADEEPFFCLLDDDERIVDLRVATDRYLNAPGSRSVHASLFVRARAERSIWANLPLA
jgi:hypothetical protein